MLKDVIKLMNVSECLKERFGIKINKNIADMIDDRALFVDFPCKDIVLLEGAKSVNLYFIMKGVVRGYYIDEQGNDITKCFSSENEFFSSEGLRTGSVSSFTIETLENCKCIQLPYKLINRVIEEDENLKNLFVKLYLREVERLEGRSIRYEARKKGVKVCTLCPGATKTNFFAQEGTKIPRGAMTSEEVAAYAYKRLMKNKEITIPGMIHRIARLFPVKVKMMVIAEIKNTN